MIYLYLLKAGPYTKIGVTSAPLSRFKQINNTCPLPLRVHKIMAGDIETIYSLEKKLHNMFEDYNTNNEWFELSDTALTLCEQTIKAYKDPSTVNEKQFIKDVGKLLAYQKTLEEISVVTGFKDEDTEE